jgi:hypothetical protein
LDLWWHFYIHMTGLRMNNLKRKMFPFSTLKIIFEFQFSLSFSRGAFFISFI